MMEQLVVGGGHPIRGEMIPAGNKNEALPCLAAALLTEEPVRIENVPAIADTRTMVELLENVGCTVEASDHAVTVGAAIYVIGGGSQAGFGASPANERFTP
jgi:UDP-N-acetylglucosamine 1-carboxyvinyltransferase